MQRLDARYLLQLDRAGSGGDGALARQALAELAHGAYAIFVRHRQLAEQLLHETLPDALDEPDEAPYISAREETPPAADRGNTSPDRPVAMPAQLRTATAEDHVPLDSAREETRPAADEHNLSTIPAREETAGSAQSDGDRLRELLHLSLAQQRAAVTIPQEQAPPAARRPAEQPASPSEAAAAGESADAMVAVPRDPQHRGLSRTNVHSALEPQLFGDYWALAGWAAEPDVWLVTGEGHVVGWVERGVDGSAQWIAVYEGSFIGDITTQLATVHDTPEQAARTVQLAYLQNI